MKLRRQPKAQDRLDARRKDWLASKNDPRSSGKTKGSFQQAPGRMKP